MGSRAIYGQFIKLKYESILAYNSFVEKNIDSAISEIEVKYEDFVNKNSNLELSNDNDDLDYYLTVVDDLAYQSQTLSKDIMQYHRKSILFQFYSLLEQEFHNSSKIIGVESLTSMKNSTGKTIIEKFKTYVNGIEPELIISIQSNLEFFDKLRLVRNIVIHENSVISTDNPHFNKIDSFSTDRYDMHFLGTNDDGERVYRIELNKHTFIVEIFNEFESFTRKIYQ